MARFFCIAFLLTVALNSASAHPGHGSNPGHELSQQLVHHVTEPIHVATLLAAILLCGIATMFAVSRLAKPATTNRS